MIRPGGRVKVLDFGLAKSVEPASRVDSSRIADAHRRRRRSAGVILGTAAYMSPEQARGKPVDGAPTSGRSAACLYECLTGRQAFAGETVSDMIARDPAREPDWTALPPETPGRARDLLARCLGRTGGAGCATSATRGIELEDAREEQPEAAAATAPPVRASNLSRLAWALGGLIAGAALGWAPPAASSRLRPGARPLRRSERSSRFRAARASGRRSRPWRFPPTAGPSSSPP